VRVKLPKLFYEVLSEFTDFMDKVSPFKRCVFKLFRRIRPLIFKRFVAGPRLGDGLSPWSARRLLYILEFI